MSENPHRKSQLIIIFFTVFIYLLGFGIVIPILPLISTDFGATPLQSGLLLTAYSFMQFCFSPFWGRLSDKVGRRKVLLGCLIGEAFSYLVFAHARDLPMLFAARMMAGFFGASISTASAAISDITPPQERSRGMALIGVAFGLGFVFGPAIGGGLSIWGQSLSPEPHFATAFTMYWVAGICLLTAAVGFKFMKETLAPGLRAEVKMNRFQQMLGGFQKPVVGPLMAVFFLCSFAMSSMEGNLVLYMQRRFGWGVREVSFGFAYIGVALVFTQGFLVRRLLPKIGERRTMMIGLTVFALGLTGIAVAPSITAMAITMTLLAVGNGLTNPSILGSISLLSPADSQGGSLGLTQGLASLGRIIGPAFGGFVFEQIAITAPFWVSGILATTALAIILKLGVRLPSAAQRSSAEVL